MFIIQPPPSAAVTNIANSTIYYYGKMPDRLISFEEALIPSLWREHYRSFACVIFEQTTKEVILARDHLGLSPLYYCYQPGKKLIFGETIPEVLAQLPKRPALLQNQINCLFSEKKYYADETLYQGIYRIEPGHLIHIKSDGTITKKAFWQLEREGPMLYYDHDEDYLHHFSWLMKEAIQNATEGETHIAAEFSAGLDSSAVYSAAADMNILPQLFMHIAPPGTESANVYNDNYEKKFIDHYQLSNIQRIGVDDFDPISVFEEYASWFAGPAPYLFFMFANTIHRKVAAAGHRILLSGFGGDQGVSGQIPLNFFIPSLIHQGQYQKAWQEIYKKKTNNPFQQFKAGLRFTQYIHPALYQLAQQAKLTKHTIKNSLRSKINQLPPLLHPYQRSYYRNVREAEWDLLQGPSSHEVRMRIEYSSIISKKMGFEYRYPLLYPKLLEFILSIPLEQKRRLGQGRYLLKRYLAQFLPPELFKAYRKEEGLGIVPSTFEMYQQNYFNGNYKSIFATLPYQHLIKHKNQQMELRNCIKGFMLKTYLSS